MTESEEECCWVGGKQVKLMNLFVMSFILFAAVCLSNGAIVFDGANSYTSYKGKPSILINLNPKAPPNSSFILQAVSPGQMDYTTGNPDLNRSGIMDPKGMIIEVEGFYAAKKGINSGNIAAFVAGYKISEFNDGTLYFRIKVITPGTYTFAINASSRKIQYQHAIYLYAISEEGIITRADAEWANRYDTGDWHNLVENYGGASEEDPFFVRLYLGKESTTLVFNYVPSDGLKGGIQVDCLRVTDFSDGLIESVTMHKQELQQFELIRESLKKTIPHDLKPEEESPPSEAKPRLIVGLCAIGIPVVFIIASGALWFSSRRQSGR